MRLQDYLWDRKFLILVYSISSIFTGAIIYMGESVSLSESNGLYAVGVSLLLFVIYFAVDFIIKKKHYDALNEVLISDGIDWVNSLPSPGDTEQRVYSELLQKLYRDANNKLTEHDSKSIEDIEFITMWVHEIKTPIAASKLIIENSLDNPSEKALYNIGDEIDKIEDFVQMTLFYSRAGEFAKDYIINSASLDKIVKDCIKREYSSIANKKLRLYFDDLDFQIDTDEKWLGFIIKQILDNAIKYSLPGGVIKIYVEHMENESILCVEDEGTGIKEEDIGRIFDKNFTGTNGRKFYNSTGIGLYLSQMLARKLGHFITVTSDYGHGTKMSVHFPIWNDYFDV